MARVLPGLVLIVFLLCATSFTLVLTLGGGPSATTLEVAIYQALKLDFDPPRAVALAASDPAGRSGARSCRTRGRLPFSAAAKRPSHPQARRRTTRSAVRRCGHHRSVLPVRRGTASRNPAGGTGRRSGRHGPLCAVHPGAVDQPRPVGCRRNGRCVCCTCHRRSEDPA